MDWIEDLVGRLKGTIRRVKPSLWRTAKHVKFICYTKSTSPRVTYICHLSFPEGKRSVFERRQHVTALNMHLLRANEWMRVEWPHHLPAPPKCVYFHHRCTIALHMLNSASICFECWGQTRPQDSGWNTQTSDGRRSTNTSHKAPLDLKKYGSTFGVTRWHKHLSVWVDASGPWPNRILSIWPSHKDLVSNCIWNFKDCWMKGLAAC